MCHLWYCLYHSPLSPPLRKCKQNLTPFSTSFLPCNSHDNIHGHARTCGSLYTPELPDTPAFSIITFSVHLHLTRDFQILFFLIFFFTNKALTVSPTCSQTMVPLTPMMGSWCLSYLMSCPSEEAPASLPASPHTPAEGALHGSLEMGDLRLISSPPGGVDGLGFPLLPRPPTKSRFNSLFQNKSSLALPTHNNNNSNNNNGST